MTNDIPMDSIVTHDSAELAHTPSPTSTSSSQSDPSTEKMTDSTLNHTNGNGNDHTGDGSNQDHLISATHNEETDEMCLTQAVRFNETPLEQKLEDHYYKAQMQMDSLTTLMRQCVEEINGLVRTLMEQQIRDLTEQYRRGLDEIHEIETNQDKIRNQMIKFVQAISNSYAQIFQNPLDG